MTTTVRALFINGVFKPVLPVPIPEGTEVELTISAGSPALPPRDLAAALNKIAGLPTEGPDDNFSGADHDSVLYPK